MYREEWLAKIDEWKKTLADHELELFYKATELAREEGIRRATPRDVLDMD